MNVFRVLFIEIRGPRCGAPGGLERVHIAGVEVGLPVRRARVKLALIEAGVSRSEVHAAVHGVDFGTREIGWPGSECLGAWHGMVRAVHTLGARAD